MFMVSFRLRKGRALLGMLALVAMVTLSVAGVKSIMNSRAVTTGSGMPLIDMSETKKITVKTGEQRLEFIKAFGWEVEQEPVEVMEVIIPKEFDQTYEAYNSMQKKQGFDLSKHAGKRCKRYTYVVSNYPGQAADVRLNLLVRDNKVIGGDVCSLTAGGFIHGFAAPDR